MLLLKAFRVTDQQFAFLKSLPGKVSEHVRLAIDDYIMKKKLEPAISQSKGKK